MTTNFHTPITTGEAANAATINAPLAQLDAALGELSGAFGQSTVLAELQELLSITLPRLVDDVQRRQFVGLRGNFPATASLGTVFADAQNVQQYYAEPDDSNMLFLPYQAGEVRLSRKLRTAATGLLVVQFTLVSNGTYQPTAGDWVDFRLCDSRGAALVNLRITYGDQSGATGTAAMTLTTNEDATGATKTGIVVKSAGNTGVGGIFELHADPVTHTCNAAVGHGAITDYGDGVRAADLEDIGAALDWTGTITEVQVYAPGRATTGTVMLKMLAVAENPLVAIGDSITNRLRNTLYAWDSDANGVWRGELPLITHGMDGRTIVNTSYALAVSEHWAKQSYLQGYKRILVGPIGTNDYGNSGSGSEAAINIGFCVILSDLAQQTSLESVIVADVPPRGPTSARDANTIAAVGRTNTLLRNLCRCYGFRYLDTHALLGDGDAYAAGLSDDGVHPNHAGSQVLVRALEAGGFDYRDSYCRRVLRRKPANLLAYWPLAETGGWLAFDVAGNSRHGAFAYLLPAVGQAGIGDGLGALKTGVTNWVNAYSSGLASAFSGTAGTLSIWVRVAGAGVWSDNTHGHIACFIADANNRIYLCKEADNALYWRHQAGGVFKQVSATTTSTSWLHMALTWSASANQAVAYLNGTQVGAALTGLGTWVGALASDMTALGAYNAGGLAPWDGYLAHAVLFNAALSAAEIADLATVQAEAA